MSQKKKNFLNKPFYPGGNEAMDAFIKAELQYPEAALEARQEGTVKVKLTMDHKGKVIHTEALNHLGFGLEEEAMRVVKLLQFKIAKNRRLRVTFHKELNIHFKLPQKAAPNPQLQSIQYNYIYKPAQKPKKKVAKKPIKKSYSYHISLK